jgi:hypothetical protein
MKRACLIALFLCSFLAARSHAATKTLTLADNMKFWISSTGKDFKQIKTKTSLTTVPIYTGRMLDSLAVTGLTSGDPAFTGLAADMQTALTRLSDDLQTIRTKNSDFSKLIGAVTKELKTIAGSATPASIESAQNLYSTMFLVAGDGEFSDKDKEQVNDAMAEVLASTPSLPATNVTNLQGAVSAMLAGQGVTKADLGLIQADLKTIATLIKAL